MKLTISILTLLVCCLTLVAQTSQPSTRTKTVDIEVPTRVWPGWESGLIDADPNPPATQPSPDEYQDIATPPGEKPTFTGKVVGLNSYDGVEVTVISVFPREYFSHNALITASVRPDGSFTMKAQEHPERANTICVRAPGRPWTYLNHDFPPGVSGKDIVIRPLEGKRIKVSASLMDDAEKSWVMVEAFDGYLRRDREGKPVFSEYFGGWDGADGSASITLPLRPMALRIRAKGSANSFVMVDPREIDQLNVRLPREAKVNARISLKGAPYAFKPVWFFNPAARLSWGGVETDAKGEFELSGLMPGQFIFMTDSGQFNSLLKPHTNDLSVNLTP